MPRTHVALPKGKHASWLDMLTASPPSPRPRRQPKATPKMLLRISALRVSLSIIQLFLSTRTHMHLLYQTRGAYCIHCTPQSTRGLCGPTCPLLRPYAPSTPFYGDADSNWTRQLGADKVKYREIIADMAIRGTQVYAATVARWERAAARLREACEVPTEMWERMGWPLDRVLEGKVRVEFKDGWEFERAWGRGGRMEGEVPPEVESGSGCGKGVKRKFPECVGGDDDDDEDDDCGPGLLEGKKRMKRA